ncbi:MAG: SIS domain-containing protein [Eubacteriales bacterium]|nr:SIS domain-containing protein [Eubacteriales bacterium]
MKKATMSHLDKLLNNRPKLVANREDIVTSFNILSEAFSGGGKLLICGNGGSAADSDHIVGELMKGFLNKRPVADELAKKLDELDRTGQLSQHLQQGLPAISLSAHSALSTAVCNDLSSDLMFAQQVLGYGRAGDVLIGISTSGNSSNVLNAGIVAKALNLKTIGLTGENGGKMNELFDLVIKVPSNRTPDIQELHLPVYHTICAMLEEEFFGTEAGGWH